jgi:NADH dehydrogenase [ubiquinone] 1 alpha subcomplex assembly factor 7
MSNMVTRLTERIRTTGPLTVAAFMTEALFDPKDGYYATKDPIGAGADFITAPEVSQMFGELIGLWAAQSWMDMGSPARFQFIELGPGRGTMMSDALRAARTVPGFLDAAQITLIEASAALKSVQARTLGSSGAQISWSNRLEAVAPGPTIIVGNEFLDCLPVRQAVRHGGEWHERLVGLEHEDSTDLVFVLGPPLGIDTSLIPANLKDLPDGSLVELRPGDQQILDAIANRFKKDAGRALLIDYGPAVSEQGDTLQALRAHTKVAPLDAPGNADITARVDFQALIQFADNLGMSSYGPVEQGQFLVSLGMEARAAALIQAAPKDKAAFAKQVWRLTDPEQMGTLFKFVCFDSVGLPLPPGFSAR